MERFVLGAILVVAVGALVWMVVRAIRRAGERASNPSCAGCPFEPKCEMKDRPHEQEDRPHEQQDRTREQEIEEAEDER